MANKKQTEKIKMTGTRILACILAGLMLVGAIATIIACII